VVGETLADRYELEELVGTGGMSSVFKAHDRVLERNVAVKILHERYGEDEEFVQRFRQEARAVAQLSHPNIVTVIDRGDDGGRQYIVFEYVEGENLKDLVARTGPLPVDQALSLGIQIARGLAFAHQFGLVHRDVKPQNVLLNGDGDAKVTDFGIARSLSVGKGMTQTGTVLGTSNYIAPEQASGQPVDQHSDVYSLGVVLFELLTGRLPFDGDNFVTVAMRHINELPPDVRELRPDVPARVAAAVDRGLEKDPAERWPSMDELVAELEACLDDYRRGDGENATLVIRRPRRAAPKPAQSRRRRTTWPLLLAVLGLAALAGATVAVLADHDALPTVPGVNEAGGAAVTVHLTGVRAYDPPPGDGSEHDGEAGLATDGQDDTRWTTQHYNDGFAGVGKQGVGLVLDAGRAVRLKSLAVTTDTPGFTARVDYGDSEVGPFPNHAAGARTVNGTTTFSLGGGPARYYVLWLTSLPPGSDVAHVNEVRAAGTSS
jgi:eukaryotic-like serine/threonine-protein kinase